MLNQGNRTEAIKYQALELNEHYHLTDLWPPRHTLDKLTLWFNKYSNGFGNNWLQGVGFFLLVTLILYILTLSTVLGWPWQWGVANLNDYASHYFDFINPTSHIWKRWDFIYELEFGKGFPEDSVLPWGIKLLLFVSKILIITMIYQIVQAFRKFGKR